MKRGFIPSVPKEGDYIHGDGMLGTVALVPDGQWDLWLPQDEFQNRGYETYACVSEATIHCTEILQRKKCTDPTQYGVRFLAQQSGTGTKQGNDFNTVAEILRTGGVCQEIDWPFGAPDYQTFYKTPPAKIKELAGYQFRDNKFGHSWVMDTSPAGMKNALPFSPLALSVFAWPIPDVNGIYHRPPGTPDVHAVTVYGYEDSVAWHIFDSYDQTHKKLAWDYGFGIGKRFTLDRVINTNYPGVGSVNWTMWINAVRRWLGV